MSDYIISNDVLIDIKGKKIAPWREKKERSVLLSQSYYRLNLNKFDRVAGCSSFLEFHRFTDNTLNLNYANFCRDRLCPMCSWRRSLKIFSQVSKVIDYISLNHESSYLFATFTIRNCSIEDLSETIDLLLYSWKKLSLQKKFKSVVTGSFRALEVTYNKKTDEWHPHLHVILSVDKNYFSNSYISQKEWSVMWHKALKVDNMPIVDIRRLKTLKGVSEASKYSVKGSDYLYDDTFLTDKLVMSLDLALSNRRLASFTGLFKEVHKKLNLDDPEDGDIVYLDSEEINDQVDYILEKYQWFAGFNNYYLVSNEP